MDHEKEDEVAEATRKEENADKHTIGRKAKEARVDVELWRTQRV